MAAVALVVVVILVVLGVHSCQVSSRNSALQDYGNNVSSLIQQSNQVSKTLFDSLSQGGGAAAASSLQTTINQTLGRAENALSSAKSLGVPGEVSAAQQNLILALQMRRDGIANIAGEIQPALGSSTNKDAINAMAAQMARFYASDVLYKDNTTPLIAGALHAAGIAVGGTNGETLEPGQFLPDLGWLTPDFIATKLGASSPTASAGKPAPGAHGHSLDSVSVNGTTLQTGSANTITASPPPTFTLNFTNGGQNTETNVQLKVVVSGTSVTGQAVVPQTTPGEHAMGQVMLSSSPPAGTSTVTATVAPVPSEKDTSNNSLSFPVTFR